MVTTNERIQAAREYAQAGYPVFPLAPGTKRPATEHGLKDATDDADQIEQWWTRWPDANIGLATDGLLVLDLDPGCNGWASPDEQLDLAGVPMQTTPRGGRHYVFRGGGYRNTAGKVAPHVDTRADGGYIVAAPSVVDGKAYEWQVPLESSEALSEPPAWLVARLRDAKEGNHRGDYTTALQGVGEGERNGSAASVVGGILSRFDPRNQSDRRKAWGLAEAWNRSNRPPLSDSELRGVFDSIAAKEVAKRNNPAAVTIRNYKWQTTTDEDGNETRRAVPMAMGEIIESVTSAADGWPRRINGKLFVHDGDVCYLDKPQSLFGWLGGSVGMVDWKAGSRFVNKQEFHAELSRTARRHESIEIMPHWPAVPEAYYTCDFPEPGDGTTLDKLIEFFEPATEVDRQLLYAAWVTPAWGGAPGSRPAFLITAAEGRGRGKSKLVQFIATLYGGAVDVAPQEDISRVKSRLLTAESATRRVVLCDNIKSTRFSWAELEALITASTVSGWELYQGDASRDNRLCWYLTLNGASLSTDIAQRCVEVQLATPSYQADWDARLRGFIETNADAIIADVAAFYQRQPQELPQASRWATWEGDVLARLDNPAECWKAIMERRAAADVEIEESELLESYFAGRLAALGYDVETECIFIPTGIAAEWYNSATGEKKRTTGASRTLRQMIDEGQLHRLFAAKHPDPKVRSRGFEFAGEHCDVESRPATDLLSRIKQGSEGDKWD